MASEVQVPDERTRRLDDASNRVLGQARERMEVKVGPKLSIKDESLPRFRDLIQQVPVVSKTEKISKLLKGILC